MSNVVELKVKTTPVVLQCSACGIEIDAGCGCNASYEPAGKRAAKASEANPGASARAIAEKIGVGAETVRRKRSGASNGAPEKTRVTGKDGKSYPAQRRKRTKRAAKSNGSVAKKYDACDEINYPKASKGENQAIFNFRYLVSEAINYCDRASIEIEAVAIVPAQLIANAREVAAAWTALANKLKRRQTGGRNGKRQTEKGATA